MLEKLKTQIAAEEQRLVALQHELQYGLSGQEMRKLERQTTELKSLLHKEQQSSASLRSARHALQLERVSSEQQMAACVNEVRELAASVRLAKHEMGEELRRIDVQASLPPFSRDSSKSPANKARSAVENASYDDVTAEVSATRQSFDELMNILSELLLKLGVGDSSVRLQVHERALLTTLYNEVERQKAMRAAAPLKGIAILEKELMSFEEQVIIPSALLTRPDLPPCDFV